MNNQDNTLQKSGKKKIPFKKLRNAIALLIIVAFVFFFGKGFLKNIEDIRSVEMNLNYGYFALAFFFIIFAYLVNTLCWQQLINSFHHGKSVNYIQSIGIVNTTQLAKYIPGKLWSFAAQVLWLDKRGFSASRVLFVNIIATISSLLSLLLIGSVMWSVSNSKLGIQDTLLLVSAIFTGYGIFIFFHTPLLNLLIKIVNRLFHKELTYIEISWKQLVFTQFLYLITNMLFATGCYFICLGTGITNDLQVNAFIVSSMLIGDIVGYVAFIAPGGIGIREGIMFFMIAGSVNKQSALIFPVVSRFVIMLADIFMGLAGLCLIRRTLRNVSHTPCAPEK